MPRAKWLTGLTVSALLITSMAPSALAETGYITSKTKIYQQPRTNSVSMVVPKGTEVIIVEYGKGSYDGWVRIENPSNGVTAYVKERYVAEDEDSKDEPPAQEEEERPEEVERKLHRVQKQRVAACAVRFGKRQHPAVRPARQQQIAGKAHEQVEDRPDDREHPARGRQRRLPQRGIGVRRVAGQQPGERAHGERDGQAKQQRFPLHMSFHVKSVCWIAAGYAPGGPAGGKESPPAPCPGARAARRRIALRRGANFT